MLLSAEKACLSPKDIELLLKIASAILSWHCFLKEKHREKKRKKEKKDREKREDKEKKEKDRSEGKHRDKKDKKERHKDKKKDKEERERDKEKNGAADERRLSGQADGNNKEKNTDKDRLSWHSGGPSGEKTIQDAEKDKNKNHTLHDKGAAAQLASFSAEKITQKNQNSHFVGNSNDSKFVQELGKRVRDGAGLGSQLVEKFTGVDRKKDGGMAEAAIPETGSLPDRKDKTHERKGDDRKLGERGIKDERKFSGNSVVLNSGASIQTVPRPVEKNVDRKMEGKEKIKEKEGDNKGWDKRSIVDMHQIKIQGKDKDRDREKRKEGKAKKSEGRKNELERLGESKKDNADATPTPDVIAQHLENTNKVTLTGVNLKKRKDIEANGFLHENEAKLHKLPRPTSTSHHLMENGRILDPSQTPSKFLLDRWDFPDALKAEIKENKVNGILDTKPDPISTIHPLPEKSLEDLLAEAAARSPHHDSKYLDELLAVPKLEELPELERDDDWLFASRRQKPKKEEGGSSKVEEETPRIWDKAVYLESADIVALPYVVPF
ncbi:uncharacterized protein LOC115683435 isoform X1 [Syzygium oleosum]|uniref:uncharacterized protein LOC115683435 isoform X1 n=1 Tax=Syzygium oleosum TaxID=219896 RepID=UPI0024BAB2B9|nr:uncharacterized protein LOC115683435 isoform X1 [Syzygium oleosum]XP_056168641.1 uncharacterized protein LOC115683435 isoform X1 [Syzygium oleosum]XP_056168645.1 uncharacterized protein LOC115683435 isoform X1 [Syzygium oleosum]